MKTIHMLGRDHAITLPGFAEREDVAVAYSDAYPRGGVRLMRAYSAAIGLCTRVGRESGHTLGDHKYDVLAYGGAVYGYLRGQGVPAKEIVEQGLPCVSAICDALAPRESEVREKEDFTGPVEAK